ncbi:MULTISPECIES: signal peptidase I [Gordonia]|uniref:Signal peptidase I n=2 Tax=Gordonia TaxID=2053 RepID=L7LN01_9ACTN|nr:MULTISPECIES: signal peptidase I [Gordonia]AUH69298.1 signal peptidase I [Gordonia sp. YC-JH1]KXT57711.1 signal peptidase [Gordonia sp. QH-12]MBY4569848.1 signal peptidase I [Gordonia sihwensis]WFN94390.1 signal peptidase I [Gordonia sihwensis]GAC62495.1 signal peptidase I [Gordonia sihwensis NBRC 108236]
MTDISTLFYVDDNTRGDDPSQANDERGSSGGAESDSGFTFRDDAPEDEQKGKSRWLRELLIIVGIVLVLMFVFTQFFFRQYVVPSESMEPTLHGCYGCTNDHIVVDKMVYRFSDPKPGDVVVFKAPTSSWDEGWSSPRSSNPVVHKIQDVLSLFALAPPDENNLVKRVIAVGGQTVQCREADGKGVTVDGKPLHEPYIDKQLQAQTYQQSGGVLGQGSCYGSDFGPIKVPEGNLWVMGDNRSNSADSRAHIDDEFHGTVPVSDVRGKVRFIIYPFSRIGGVGSVDPQS